MWLPSAKARRSILIISQPNLTDGGELQNVQNCLIYITNAIMSRDDRVTVQSNAITKLRGPGLAVHEPWTVPYFLTGGAYSIDFFFSVHWQPDRLS